MLQPTKVKSFHFHSLIILLTRSLTAILERIQKEKLDLQQELQTQEEQVQKALNDSKSKSEGKRIYLLKVPVLI